MGIQELLKSILRTRILRLHEWNLYMGKSPSDYKKYLILGSDVAIEDFTRYIQSTEPVVHTTFII